MSSLVLPHGIPKFPRVGEGDRPSMCAQGGYKTVGSPPNKHANMWVFGE